MSTTKLHERIYAPYALLEHPRPDPTVVNFASFMPTSADYATSSGTSSSSRLRAVTGAFVMLLGSPAAIEAAAAAAREVTAAPAAIYARGDLDPTGGLAGALRRSRQRPPSPPDGHLAAVLPRFDRGALAAAVRRARGQPR